MTTINAKIEASHNAAASRAKAFLNKLFKLEKLSSTQAKELVAAIYGVANWSTLLAMAKNGVGPRVDVSPPVELTPKEILARRAHALAAEYETDHSWGEHPTHTRALWREEVENDGTLLSYWEHVVNELDNAWDEDQDESAQ